MDSSFFPALYDDILHVDNACAMLENAPGYRFLIYALSCTGGESLWFNRVASAICLGLAWSLFVRAARRPARDFWWIFHPLVAFSFFYASQFSTAFTLLWACAGAWCVLNWARYRPNGPRPGPQLVRAAIPLLLLGVAGSTIRMEAAVFQTMVLFAIWGLAWVEGRRWPARRELWTWLGFLVYFGVISQLLRGLFPVFSGGPAALLQLRIEEPFYPMESHLPVQAYAGLLYLRSFLLPIYASFFGPWTDWWALHVSTAWRIYVVAGWVGVASAAAWLMRPRFSAPLRFFSAGVLVFLAAAAVLSAYLRADWYFLSRTTLPGFLAGLYVVEARRRMATKGLWGGIRKGMPVYVLLAFALHAGLHYSTLENFIRYELNWGGKDSPITYRTLARLHEQRGQSDKVVVDLHHAHQMIPVDSLAYSQASRSQWLETLFYGHRASLVLGDESSSESALKVLMGTRTALGVLACLENPRWPIDECRRDAETYSKFCRTFRPENMKLPAVPDSRFFRANLPEFCGDDALLNPGDQIK